MKKKWFGGFVSVLPFEFSGKKKNKRKKKGTVNKAFVTSGTSPLDKSPFVINNGWDLVKARTFRFGGTAFPLGMDFQARAASDESLAPVGSRKGLDSQWWAVLSGEKLMPNVPAAFVSVILSCTSSGP